MGMKCCPCLSCCCRWWCCCRLWCCCCKCSVSGDGDRFQKVRSKSRAEITDLTVLNHEDRPHDILSFFGDSRLVIDDTRTPKEGATESTKEAGHMVTNEVVELTSTQKTE